MVSYEPNIQSLGYIEATCSKATHNRVIHREATTWSYPCEALLLHQLRAQLRAQVHHQSDTLRLRPSSRNLLQKDLSKKLWYKQLWIVEFEPIPLVKPPTTNITWVNYHVYISTNEEANIEIYTWDYF